MITADNLAAVLEGLVRLAWPCAVGWFVWYYRDEIGALLRKLERLRLPGGVEASFEGQTSEELTQQRPEEVPPDQPVLVAPSEADIKWGNSANLYWLGYDMATAVDRLGYGAPRDSIVHSLRQSWWHAKQLGFTDPAIIQRLEKLKDGAKGSLEREWDSGKRDRYIGELYTVVKEIEKLAIEHQPDFDPAAKE